MHFQWQKHDSLDSTSLELARLLSEGEPEEGFVIYTDYQSSGKGQGIHGWFSDAGRNLLMSLLLRPAFLSASSQFLLSQLCSLAICKLLESRGLQPLIKWPNDILVDRKKIAGILIEHGVKGPSLSHSILGIGLNVAQLEFPEFDRPATSLALELERTGDSYPAPDPEAAPPGTLLPEHLGRELLELLSDCYDHLVAGEHELIRAGYLEKLYLKGEEQNFLAGGKMLRGRIEGISEFGELLIRTAEGVKKFQHGELRFLL